MYSEDANWQLCGDTLTMGPLILPPDVLEQAAGKRATDVLDHPCLSADISIVEAKADIEEGFPQVCFKLKVPPPGLFCAIAGGSGMTQLMI